MSNTQIQKSTKAFFESPQVQAKFESILKDRSQAFITSVLQIVNSNDMLRNVEPMSVFNAAMTAATMDLPINNNLGFAYIVPYGRQAQFQVGYKGFIQLAQRSGQFLKINSAAIYKGQLVSNNPLEGATFDFNVEPQGEPIGYAAYFKLLNGFEAHLYMTKEQVDKHAQTYSKMYGKGVWKTNFEAMAKKTVLKLLLSRYAPMSIETKQVFEAIKTDQAAIQGEEMEAEYIDNPIIEDEPSN